MRNIYYIKATTFIGYFVYRNRYECCRAYYAMKIRTPKILAMIVASFELLVSQNPDYIFVMDRDAYYT